MGLKLDQLSESLRVRIEQQLAAERASRFPADHAGPAAVMECDPGDGPLAKKAVQRPAGQRFLVRVESRRKRLLDEDNICEKQIVDLLRYSRVIPGDAPGICQIRVSQEKCGKDEPEEITITVYEV